MWAGRLAIARLRAPASGQVIGMPGRDRERRRVHAQASSHPVGAGADRPADPGRPERMARIVGAARQLADAEEHAGAEHREQPGAGPRRVVIAPLEVHAEEREGRDRMAGREAVPASAVGLAEAPVREVARRAAEFGEVPRTAGRAVVLDRGHCQRAEQHHAQPGDSLPAIRGASDTARGAHGGHHQRDDHRPCQPAAAPVEQAARPHAVARREAVRAGEPSRHRQVGAAEVPREQGREEQARDAEIAAARLRSGRQGALLQTSTRSHAGS